LSIELLSRHFDLQTIRILSKILIIRCTYSIRMSSPVIIIFYFSFLGSPSPLLSFSFDVEPALFCSLIVARRGCSLHSPVVESSTWEFDFFNLEFLLPIVSSGLLQSPLSLEISTFWEAPISFVGLSMVFWLSLSMFFSLIPLSFLTGLSLFGLTSSFSMGLFYSLGFGASLTSFGLSALSLSFLFMV